MTTAALNTLDLMLWASLWLAGAVVVTAFLIARLRRPPHSH